MPARKANTINTEQGLFLGIRERHPTPVKGEKCTTKAIFGENFLWMLFYIILYLWNPHYTLLYYLVSLYQIIWNFTDPENDSFWKKFAVSPVFYPTLIKFHFCLQQMLSIWNIKIFVIWYGGMKLWNTPDFFSWVGERPRGRQIGKKMCQCRRKFIVWY